MCIQTTVGHNNGVQQTMSFCERSLTWGCGVYNEPVAKSAAVQDQHLHSVAVLILHIGSWRLQQ